jgi:serine/threonine protein kinase
MDGAEHPEVEATAASGQAQSKGRAAKGERVRSIVGKLADFGTVRNVNEKEHELGSGSGTGSQGERDTKTHVHTKLVCGTKPYMPPEYTQRGHVSEKTDAFAFGLMTIELLTGLHPTYARELIDEVRRVHVP